MTFTYDLTATGDSLIASRIRLEIGDTDNSTDAGVKPDGTNFTDEELVYFYDQESSIVEAGAARACEVLARFWALHSESVRIRDYQLTARQQATQYRRLAEDLRERSGTLFKSGSAPVLPVDGYSNDVNSQQTDAGGDEYWQSRKTLKWP